LCFCASSSSRFQGKFCIESCFYEHCCFENLTQVCRQERGADTITAELKEHAARIFTEWENDPGRKILPHWPIALPAGHKKTTVDAFAVER
jgi:hypothetical protein